MTENKFGRFFSRLKKNNIYHIFYYLDLFDITEFSFISHNFSKLISSKFQKKTTIIKTTITICNSKLKINLPCDFPIYLRNNCKEVRKEINEVLKLQSPEGFSHLPIKKYFFNHIGNLNITTINLKNDGLGKKSIKYLSYYIESHNEVKNIILSGNKLNGQMLEPLSNMEKVNEKEFNVIKLNKCGVDQNTFKFLSVLNVIKLSLKSCNIGNLSLNNLYSVNLQELNLSNNSLTNEATYSICLQIPNLISLNLSKNSLTDISMLYIGLYIKEPKCQLINLNLEDNQITISGAIALINIINETKKKFDKINLNSNVIDSLPKRLINFNNLSINYFCIGGHSFTIEDLGILFDFLNANSKIIKLDLSQTILDNVLLHFIFKKLTENQFINKIKLKNCYLGNTEINDILYSYFTNEDCKNKINSMNLTKNFLSFKNISKIILTNHLQELNLEGNNLISWGENLKDFFDSISQNQILKFLNLNNNFLGIYGKYFLHKIGEHNIKCSLEKIYLNKNIISDVNIELTNVLVNNKNLKEIYLKHNEIGDKINNNYFFHSLTITELNILNLKENKIKLDFINKLLQYKKENPNFLNNFKVYLNISSQELRNEYENEVNKSIYFSLSNINNLTAL